MKVGAQNRRKKRDTHSKKVQKRRFYDKRHYFKKVVPFYFCANCAHEKSGFLLLVFRSSVVVPILRKQKYSLLRPRPKAATLRYYAMRITHCIVQILRKRKKHFLWFWFFARRLLYGFCESKNTAFCAHTRKPQLCVMTQCV